jgi:hypothetical protein
MNGACACYYGLGRGAGVGRDLGVIAGRAVGVGLTVTVGVAVGVAVAVAVALTVGVGESVAVDVAVGVTVGVTLGITVGVGEAVAEGVGVGHGALTQPAISIVSTRQPSSDPVMSLAIRQRSFIGKTIGRLTTVVTKPSEFPLQARRPAIGLPRSVLIVRL